MATNRRAFSRNVFHDVVDKSLMLWETVPLDNSIKDSWVQEFAPVQGCNVGFSPNIEFDIPPSLFPIHLPSTTLYVKGRILQADKGKIIKKDGTNAKGEVTLKIAPVNNMLHSMFDQLNVELNHTPVISANSYNYTSYLVHTLGYSKASKETWLRSCGMYYDTFGNVEPNVPDIEAVGNNGQKARFSLVQSSQTFELEGRPSAGLFHVDKLIPSMVALKLSFSRAGDRFFLMSGESTLDATCKLFIDECKLRITYVELPEVIAANLEKKITAHPITYMIHNHLVCKDYTISQGVVTSELTRLFNNRIPKRLVVALISNEAKNGSYRLNPFYFTGRNVRRLALRVNDRYVPLKPITLDYDKSEYQTAYNMLNDSVGRGLEDWSPGITYDMFPYGYCFYCWSLVPLNNSEDFTLTRYGDVSLTLDFKSATTTPLTVLCWGEFTKSFSINSDRLVDVEDI